MGHGVQHKEMQGHNNTKQVYTMKGQQLEVTEEERDIGVTMSKNLKPSAQCAKAARTAQTVLAQISRAFHFRDRQIFVRLYVQNVRPQMEFSGPAWSPWLETDKEVLEKIQRRAVGMVSGLRADTYEERLRELGLTTLEERRHQADIIQTFKILHKKDSVRGETWFTMASEANRATRRTADPLNLMQQPARLDIRRNFYSSRVVERWNEVPASLKQDKSVNAFKNGYKVIRSKMVQHT